MKPKKLEVKRGTEQMKNATATTIVKACPGTLRRGFFRASYPCSSGSSGLIFFVREIQGSLVYHPVLKNGSISAKVVACPAGGDSGTFDVLDQRDLGIDEIKFEALGNV